MIHFSKKDQATDLDALRPAGKLKGHKVELEQLEVKIRKLRALICLRTDQLSDKEMRRSKEKLKLIFTRESSIDYK